MRIKSGPVVEFDSPPLHNRILIFNDYEEGILAFGGFGSGNRYYLFRGSI